MNQICPLIANVWNFNLIQLFDIDGQGHITVQAKPGEFKSFWNDDAETGIRSFLNDK